LLVRRHTSHVHNRFQGIERVFAGTFPRYKSDIIIWIKLPISDFQS